MVTIERTPIVNKVVVNGRAVYKHDGLWVTKFIKDGKVISSAFEAKTVPFEDFWVDGHSNLDPTFWEPEAGLRCIPFGGPVVFIDVTRPV
jgi:hypothetical protein